MEVHFDAKTRTSQETLYSLAESISAHLSSLGDALHGITPSDSCVEEVRLLTAVLFSTTYIDYQLATGDRVVPGSQDPMYTVSPMKC